MNNSPSGPHEVNGYFDGGVRRFRLGTGLLLECPIPSRSRQLNVPRMRSHWLPARAAEVSKPRLQGAGILGTLERPTEAAAYHQLNRVSRRLVFT